MRNKPKIVKREGQRYAGIRQRLGRDELSELVASTLSEVAVFLEKRRVPIVGAPLVRYLVVDYNTGGIEVDIGFPVGEGAIPARGRVCSNQIDSGTFAVATHHGPYHALVETTAALLEWAKSEGVSWRVAEGGGVTRWAARVEHYLVGPPDELDAGKWQTEIAILVSPDFQ